MAAVDTKKSVLITGCSDGGIGSALAQEFHAQNFHVFATARTESKMADLGQLLNVTFLTLDVLDASQITKAVQNVTQKTGGTLDVLINNSGRNHFMPVLDINIEEAKRIFDTNFWGALNMIHAFAPLVIKAKGSIVNVTSIAGHVNVPYMGLYAASKHSLEIISETLRLEMQPFNVTVLSVVTGAVDTLGNSYFTDFKLPEGSIYAPIESTIASRAQGHDGVKRASRKEYAIKVVAEVARGVGGKMWCGSNAGGVKFGKTFVPQSILDPQMAKGCDLDKLGKNS